jgi:SAM-dependent methyltransferase
MAQTAADATNPDYDAQAIRFLELMWGKGYLSPGGDDETDRVVAGVNFTGKRVLDIGCGLGGSTFHLARTTPLAHITGYDVEAPVIEVATARAHEAGLADRVHFVRADPGPLPFADGAFDIVFSKEALLHIPGKPALCAEMFRVLAPGGEVAAGDWMVCHDGEMSEDMKAYVAHEDLGFAMGSPAEYESAMKAAGFTDVRTVPRNTWYRDRAARELAEMTGPRHAELVAACGQAYVGYQIATWTLMLKVLESGEHCPTHLFGRKS